jgi:DNA (cytosine-5)-methyltransferase 1
MITFGSVCSGIGAPEMAWGSLGWRCAFVSEIEKFPRAVLQHRLGAGSANGPALHGDFTTIGSDEYGTIDLLVGGTPCQSFSVAGLRGGLSDGRGNLALEFLRLADRTRPRWLVWENVPGVLSSDGGRDFGSIVGGMVELGYGIFWRVLDAQYIGVPQRRRRVFVVGYLGDWRRAAAVLLERQSLRRNPPPRRKAGEGASCTVAPSLTGSGRGVERCGESRGQDPVIACAAVASTLEEGYGDKLGLDNQHVDRNCPLFVTHSLRGEGFDASEDGTGRGTPIVPVAFSSKDYGNDVGEISPTLRSMNHDKSHANGGGQIAVAYAIQERAGAENPDNGPDGKGWKDDGTSYTLEGRQVPQSVAYAIDSQFNGREELAGPLTAHAGTNNLRSVAAYDLRGRDGGAMLEGPHDTANIRAASGGASRSFIADSLAVRRLMPMEAERLQGFPDDYTAIPWRGKPSEKCPDGPRYKALGNSMAVPVMRWIGERIAVVDAIPVGAS